LRSLRSVPWKTLLLEFAGDPVEFVVGVPDKALEHGEVAARRAHGDGIMPWPPCPYEADADWEERLHRVLGVPWPCPAIDAFWRLWPEVMRPFETRGMTPGRGAFAGWGDGEPGLARTAWCLVHHLRPRGVVETGVGRGVTTRVILEALEANGGGHLWSIDLPPAAEREIHDQIGMAVRDGLRARWTYVRGSSRRRLPRLLARTGEIDLFVHDSRHTARNLLFELNRAWGALRSGGAVIADDVDLNCGFHTFQAAHRDCPVLVCHAEPLQPDEPRQDGRGVFGVAVKAPGARTDGVTAV
jgi:Methyltransferase domain